MSVVLSLGSDLGDRRLHLRAGIEVLAQYAGIGGISPVYETEPVGGVDSPPYLNLIVLLETAEPEWALTAAHAAEESRGRLRSHRWGPRTLDVDVIAAGARTSADPRLTVPHPRAHQRGFVLIPWLDLDPVAELPGQGLVRHLVQRAGRAGVQRHSDPLPMP